MFHSQVFVNNILLVKPQNTSRQIAVFHTAWCVQTVPRLLRIECLHILWCTACTQARMPQKLKVPRRTNIRFMKLLYCLHFSIRKTKLLRNLYNLVYLAHLFFKQVEV